MIVDNKTNRNVFVVGFWNRRCKVEQVLLTGTIPSSVLSRLAEEACLLSSARHDNELDAQIGSSRSITCTQWNL